MSHQEPPADLSMNSGLQWRVAIPPGQPSLNLRMALGLSVVLFFQAAAGAAEREILRDHVPAVVKRLQPTGRLESAERLDLAIGLPLRNREALTNLLREIYNPASANFHHYLTPEQFAEQFGPAEKDYRALMEFAKSNHLSVTGVHPNRTVLDV